MNPKCKPQFEANNKWLADKGIVDTLPLRQKYLVETAPKFGGKKRKGSNSGGVGRAGRRRHRGRS